jgi:SnoaL-like domain
LTFDARRRLHELYAAFNGRKTERALSMLHDAVDWPNGWEGGVLSGKAAVRDYWVRQWAEISPAVTPTAYESLPDGRVSVRVRQLVRDKAGVVLSSGLVAHVFTFEGEQVRAMEIRPLD